MTCTCAHVHVLDHNTMAMQPLPLHDLLRALLLLLTLFSCTHTTAPDNGTAGASWTLVLEERKLVLCDPLLKQEMSSNLKLVKVVQYKLNQGNKVRMPVMEVIWMLKIGQEHEWPTYVCSYSRNWVHFTWKTFFRVQLFYRYMCSNVLCVYTHCT